MSFKLRETADVFASLESLCGNGYRMYDPQECRSYYDHDCDVYFHVLWDAEDEYQRLLEHCMHQRDELRKWERRYLDEDASDRLERLGVTVVRGDDMSITDELRRIAAKTERASGRCEKLYRGDLDHIADRIDAEHEHDAFDALRNGFNLGRARGYDEGFKAHLADLEARVERIERLLNHKGA